MLSNPFAQPRGILGRAAGCLMASTNRAAQRQVARRLPISGGARILEIGYGPGQLMRLLLESTPAGWVAGADPSDVMLGQARRACGSYAAADRLDLRLGDAAHLPFPDGHFHHVVSVNNAPLWPDLEAGLAETRRVLRPGGTVLIAWHTHGLRGELGGFPPFVPRPRGQDGRQSFLKYLAIGSWVKPACS